MLLAIEEREEKIRRLEQRLRSLNSQVGINPMNCINHPDRKAFSICQKYNHGYCKECCTCTDPRGYCKYRTRCIAWQICREQKPSTTELAENTEVKYKQKPSQPLEGGGSGGCDFFDFQLCRIVSALI